jgi:2-desacetyl-2-hydroxyethyl bacteriochlorophyllide A dehydrogenase
MKTKGVIFPEANNFEIGEFTIDALNPGDIAVRTLITAISPGTERWVLKGRHIGTTFPCVPGYHRIGIVEKCGKEINNFQPGDIVYGFPNRWKEKVRPMWGAHIGYSVGDASEYNFISSSMPPAFQLETAAFTIVAAVAHRGVKFLEIKRGDRVLIIGAGFIGMCAAQLISLKEGIPVLVEKNRERVDFARKINSGVLWTGNKNWEKKLEEIAPCGIDCIYDTAGVPEMIDKAVQHSKNWARLLLQAQYFDREHRTLDLDQIKIREMTVKTTTGISNEDWEATFNNIKRRRLKIAPLITHRFNQENLLEGYKLLNEGKPFNLGIVFYWDEELWNKTRGSHF